MLMPGAPLNLIETGEGWAVETPDGIRVWHGADLCRARFVRDVLRVACPRGRSMADLAAAVTALAASGQEGALRTHRDAIAAARDRVAGMLSGMGVTLDPMAIDVLTGAVASEYLDAVSGRIPTLAELTPEEMTA